MIRKLSILGSTGSIGTQALDVVRLLGLKISALAAARNIDLLEKQIREFLPSFAVVYEEAAAKELRQRVADLPVKVLAGMDGLCEAAGLPEADLVLNAVVGMVGLRPTLAAIAAKKNVALANKETLVAGGALVMREAAKNQVKILPVDSEHSAIFQCLQGCSAPSAVKKIDFDRFRRPFLWKKSGGIKDGYPKTGAQASQLEHGSQGDHRFRHHDE